MSSDDLLFGMIVAGFALAGVYLRAEYMSHMRSKAAEISKRLTLRDLHVARTGLQQNGMSVKVRIVHAPLQRNDGNAARGDRHQRPRSREKPMSRFESTRSLSIGLSCAFLLLCLACTSASADQDVPLLQSPAPGMRVRILAPGISAEKLIGTVDQVNDESVTLNVPGRSEPVSILRDKIARLDVSEGLRSRGIDAAIGGGLGAAIAAAACAAANGSGRGHIVSTGGVAAACALFGGGLGALVGVAIPPGERWRQISAARYRVSFAPRIDHGLDLAAVWKF